MSSAKGAKDEQKLYQDIASEIEDELPKDLVDNQEQEEFEREEMTELDQLRAKLRTFAKAIPMMVMASQNPQELTIDNIEQTISDEDFSELFSEKDCAPEDKITKEDFKIFRDGGDFEGENGETVHFDGFFDKYVFNASIKEFEQKRNQLADYLSTTQTEDIFSYIRPQRTNQIFTPRRVVNQMLNILEAENPGVFENPHLTFCDLYVRSGLYLAEIAKRLYCGLEKQIPNPRERTRHIFEHQLYGYAPTRIIYDVATNYVFGGFSGISRQNFKLHDLTDDFKAGKELNMKFDVVVGNPPYQEETKDTSDKPIYNYFMDEAYKVADRVCFITPARFLFNAGKTPKKWNQKMLNDKHLKVAFYEQKSSEVFANTDIKGGVAITYRDANQDFGKIGTFTHFEELNSIIRKVIDSDKFKGIDSIVGVQLDYKFKKDFGFSQEGLKTNVFEKQANIFTDLKMSDEDFRVLGLKGRSRIYKWVNSKYFNLPQNHQKFKVYLPTSNGSGAIGEVLSTPLIGEPLIGHTETFIGIGEFKARQEAENLLKYIKTKFARTMLGTLKITQHNLASTWRNVPLQIFTTDSDIDWSQPISSIDRQLYKKYGLNEREIRFIEEKVKEMK